MTNDIIKVIQERLEMLRERELLCADECRVLRILVGEIEQQYIKLPLDADGVPIIPGDLIELHCQKTAFCDKSPRCKSVHRLTVETITYDGERWDFGDEYGTTEDCARVEYERMHHVKPDTIESLLEEFAKKMNENMGEYVGEVIDGDEWRRLDEETIAGYAEKIKAVKE